MLTDLSKEELDRLMAEAIKKERDALRDVIRSFVAGNTSFWGLCRLIDVWAREDARGVTC